MGEWLQKKASTPTSQLTGGGAIARGEARISKLHEGRPVLLMPSATYGLWVALRALGIGPGDEVLIPKYDWTSSLAVVLALGATPVVVPVDRATLTIDPATAGARCGPLTRAVIATHLFAIPADVPALRLALPQVPIIEDCAQAFGSRLDGRPVGVFGDAAVFSFGPGKRLDVGELGALVLRDHEMRQRALQHSAHPIRQRLNGIAVPDMASMSIRPHPLAAVLLDAALEADDSGVIIRERRRLADSLLSDTGFPLLGVDGRRRVASQSIPVLAERAETAHLPCNLKATYGEVMDVEAMAAGASKSERIAFITTAGEPLDVHQPSPPPLASYNHPEEGR